MEPVPATPLPSPLEATPERFGAGGNGASPATSGLAGDDLSAARLARARRELAEPVRLPPEGRLKASTLAIFACAAGVVAILLGGWAFVSGIRDDGGAAGPVTAPSGYEQALALLTTADVERFPLEGSVGRIILAVRPSGAAALVLNGLGEAESGWAYQAWVSRPGAITRSVALFSGDEAVVPLATPVPAGATLAVTLEPEAGSFAPTRTPKLFVERPL